MRFKKKQDLSEEQAASELNAFLGEGTGYDGHLRFSGTVRIDGAFKGEITSEGDLVLGKSAMVEGRIEVGGLYSNGRISGDVIAGRKAVLRSNAALSGSLRAPSLVVEEGAVVEGDIFMSAAERAGSRPEASEPAVAEAQAPGPESGAGAGE
ncbi:MAG: polymer-forming cytoskeletal protein [Desulfovibrionaceae bacterium]|nr:polymer-forming cytoskeletal protein [Desulfovibrionaceae bacterium]